MLFSSIFKLIHVFRFFQSKIKVSFTHFKSSACNFVETLSSHGFCWPERWFALNAFNRCIVITAIHLTFRVCISVSLSSMYILFLLYIIKSQKFHLIITGISTQAATTRKKETKFNTSLIHRICSSWLSMSLDQLIRLIHRSTRPNKKDFPISKLS